MDPRLLKNNDNPVLPEWIVSGTSLSSVISGVDVTSFIVLDIGDIDLFALTTVLMDDALLEWIVSGTSLTSLVV